MEALPALDGALLVDKPPGMTSHDVVDEIRRHFRLNKVGHCGTLDPAATGLLVLVLGRGTKLSEKLMSLDKVYEGTIKFGETTDSYDGQGELTKSMPVPPLTMDELNEAASSFLGDQMQMPPMVSAIKQNGVPLYKLARKGIEVERKPRLIRLYTFKILSYSEPFAQFKTACTKGTYIRSLAHDLGEKIGCGAHLSALRRLVSGQFSVDDALPLDDIMRKPLSGLIERVIPFSKLTGPPV